MEAERADWAVIYYAGHGFEIGGVNYLVPVDAKLAVDKDAEIEAVALEQVIATVGGARGLRLVILDACRDNPFASAITMYSSPRLATMLLRMPNAHPPSVVSTRTKTGRTA